MKRIELAHLRLARGLSQEELAKTIGVSYGVIFNIENGKMPRPSNIPKLAEAYKLTPKEFVTALFNDK